MKKSVIFLMLLMISSLLVLNNVSAQSSGCNLGASLVSQDPYPAIPGDYVELVFQISGVQNPECDGASVELVTKYPFSLNPDDSAKRSLEGSTYYKDKKSEWIVPYEVRIDKDAVEKTYEIELNYNKGSSLGSPFLSKKFNLSVEDVRTDFDAVVQELSGSDISIAIANTGKTTANSLIVRIPEQEGYRVSGTNGQMVGNLDSGDYSIVSFTLAQMGRADNPLQVQMDYTDSIGERRSLIKELQLSSSAGLNAISGQGPDGAFPSGNFPRNGNFPQQQNTSIFKSVWFWIVIFILVGVLLYTLRNFKKVKRFFSRKSLDSLSEKISKEPDWVSLERKKK